MLKDKLVFRKTYLLFSTEGILSAGWEGSQKSDDPQVRRPVRHVGTREVISCQTLVVRIIKGYFLSFNSGCFSPDASCPVVDFQAWPPTERAGTGI